jgi:integrase
MLTADVVRYLALRRAVGFQLNNDARTLKRFANYADAKSESHVKRTTVRDWLLQEKSAVMRWQRLHHLRGFALAMHAEDPRHEVPPSGMFGRPTSRHPVRIFSREEVLKLLDATAMPGINRFHQTLYETLFGLLAVTGMRANEALRLMLEDVTEDGLVIRNTKFRKNRLLPLHETTWRALKHYLACRTKQRPRCSNLFVNLSGGPLRYVAVERFYLKAARHAGLRGLPGTRGLHLHSLRHGFAVRSLESCDGTDIGAVQNHMVALSTYLGHSKFAHTQLYLHATPILAKQIADVGEAFFMNGNK